MPLFSRRLICSAVLLTASTSILASSSLSIDDLKQLPIEELSSIEMGIATKIPTQLSDTPSAVYVVTAEDMRRSGVLNLPDALRLVPGLNVASATGNSWAVNSRGFNETFSNKFLVLLDGRSLYSSTLGGVYWDEHNIRIEDIERIEVVRGPGSAVWGANAMNGVINIITRSSFNTLGGEASVMAGSNHRELNARYGGDLNDSATYRVSAKASWQDENVPGSLSGLGGLGNRYTSDDADHYRVSFRSDAQLSENETLHIDAGVYKGESGQRMYVSEPNEFAPDFNSVVLPAIQGMIAMGLSQEQIFGALILPESGLCTYCLRDVDDEQKYRGTYALGRWKEGNELDWQSAQFYVDYTHREDYQINQRKLSIDLDYERGWKQDTWSASFGTGFRSSEDNLKSGSNTFYFSPQTRRNNVWNAFLHSSWLLSDRFTLTAGVGYEYSDLFGSQWQPSLRALWSINPSTQLWSALSYSSRVPSRLETTIQMDSLYQVSGNTDQDDETLSAVELGVRHNVNEAFSLDAAAFYYQYDDLAVLHIDRVFNPFANMPGQIRFGNLASADAYGYELSARWYINPNWQVSLAYSYLNQEMDALPIGTEATIAANRAPKHQLSLRSGWDIRDDLEFDINLYYVSEIESIDSILLISGVPDIEDYIRTDIRFGWQVNPDVELSLIGKNLFDHSHPEFFSSPVNVGSFSENSEIERSVTAKLTVRF